MPEGNTGNIQWRKATRRYTVDGRELSVEQEKRTKRNGKELDRIVHELGSNPSSNTKPTEEAPLVYNPETSTFEHTIKKFNR